MRLKQAAQTYRPEIHHHPDNSLSRPSSSDLERAPLALDQEQSNWRVHAHSQSPYIDAVSRVNSHTRIFRRATTATPVSLAEHLRCPSYVSCENRQAGHARHDEAWPQVKRRRAKPLEN